MIEPPHPSEYIPEAIATAIRNMAGQAELLGSLHPEQLSIIYSQNWFNLFVPKALGGLELSLPEALRIEEALAWADGSTGWTVTLCSGANWFAGFLQPEMAAIIFGNPKVCLAGSGQPSGIAKICGEGYEITGRWHYATGAPHATAFTANCVVENKGAIRQQGDGSTVVKSFVFLRDEVIVRNDWHTTGMVGTASNSFEVNSLYVPGERCFIIEASQAVLQHPVYQYPFLQFAETTLSINVAGMAARFIELAEAVVASRAHQKSLSADKLPAVAEKFNTAKAQVKQARQQFYSTAQLSWEACVAGAVINNILLNDVSAACRLLAATCIHAVDLLYPFCGLTAAKNNTEINRVWRNLHTASQHTLLLPL